MISDILSQQTVNTLYEDTLGKSRSPRYPLPNENFTYGKYNVKDAEGAGQVIRTWVSHSPSKAPGQKRDFREMNKKSLQSGFCDSRYIHEWRKSQNAVLSVREGSKAVEMIIPEEEFRYGVANKPSTPMGNVMSNEYGLRAAFITKEMYKTIQNERKMKSVYLPKLTNSVRFSNASVAKRIEELNKTEEKALFKMSRFTKTTHKVDDHNTGYVKNLKSPRLQGKAIHQEC